MMCPQFIYTTGCEVELVLDDESIILVKLYNSEDPVRDLLNLVNYTDELSIFYVLYNISENLWGFCGIPRTKKLTQILNNDWSRQK